MIVSLAIRGLGVIEDAEVDLGPGLTAITGETGAGKTMVLSGLALLLGERTDAGIVRVGHESALAEGRFDVPQGQRPAVAAILDDAGGDWDADGSLLIARTASREGRSRAHLGGRSVPAGTLKSVGALLVAVHGQDDQHRLLHPAEQRQSLDRFAGDSMAQALDDYRESHDALLDIERRLREITDHARDRAREADELRDVLALIDDVRPQAGEDEALRRESDRLMHIDEIVQAVASAHADLEEREEVGAAGLVARAQAALDRVADRDPDLAGARDRLERLRMELDDVGVDLSRYLGDLDADPARAAKVQERRAALAGLRRRLGRLVPEGVDMADWRADAEARLAELDDDDSRAEELRGQRVEEARRSGALAERVSELRCSAAAELGHRMTEELAALAMPSARLTIEVSRRTRAGDTEVLVDGVAVPADRHGIDEVDFLLAPRKGAPARPLAKGASGGERSRVMLALEVALAHADPVATFVFDEVDAGVGGKAAVEVGRRLAVLGRSSQVIVVTHLPQVAAFADRHLVLRPGEAVTSSCLREVTGEERHRELARMLAGQEDSGSALAHAVELLDLAAEAGQAAGKSSPSR